MDVKISNKSREFGDISVVVSKDIPKWAVRPVFESRALPEDGAVNTDVMEDNAVEFDAFIASQILRGEYPDYLRKYKRGGANNFKIMRDQTAENDATQNRPTRRYDSGYPLPFVLDDDDNPREATTAELIAFHENRRETRTVEDYLRGTKFAYPLLKILRFLYECGYTKEQFKKLTSFEAENELKSDGPAYAAACRAKDRLLSQWFRRVIKGTFNVDAYAYFRDTEGLKIDPVAVICVRHSPAKTKTYAYAYRMMLSAMNIKMTRYLEDGLKEYIRNNPEAARNELMLHGKVNMEAPHLKATIAKMLVDVDAMASAGRQASEAAGIAQGSRAQTGTRQQDQGREAQHTRKKRAKRRERSRSCTECESWAHRLP